MTINIKNQKNHLHAELGCQTGRQPADGSHSPARTSTSLDTGISFNNQILDLLPEIHEITQMNYPQVVTNHWVQHKLMVRNINMKIKQVHLTGEQ